MLNLTLSQEPDHEHPSETAKKKLALILAKHPDLAPLLSTLVKVCVYIFASVYMNCHQDTFVPLQAPRLRPRSKALCSARLKVHGSITEHNGQSGTVNYFDGSTGLYSVDLGEGVRLEYFFISVHGCVSVCSSPTTNLPIIITGRSVTLSAEHLRSWTKDDTRSTFPFGTAAVPTTENARSTEVTTFTSVMVPMSLEHSDGYFETQTDADLYIV